MPNSIGDLSDSEILNTVLLEHIYDNVTVTDCNGILLQVSKSCEHNFHFRREDYVGKPISLMEAHGIFNPSISMRVLRERKKITSTQVDRTGVCRPITGIPVFDETGTLCYTVCFTSWDFSSLEELQTERVRLERELARYTAETRYLRARENTKTHVVAASPETRRLCQTIIQVAPYKVNALIQGPRGTGKSFYARMLHGGPENGPFVEIDCASLPPSMLEREIFGNLDWKGVTHDTSVPVSLVPGGTPEAMGALELAEKGTLYLSSIDALPAFIQLGLARLITRMGKIKDAHETCGVTLPRILGSSDKDIKRCIAEGNFREELFYCLGSVYLKVWPLQERQEDLAAFILRFLVEKNAVFGLSKTISPKTLECMKKYAWPGNIREVRSMVEHLLLTSPGDSIEVTDLPEELTAPPHAPGHKTGFKLREALEYYEKQLILRARAEHKTTTALARALGISQPSVVRKLAKYKKVPPV